MSSIFDNLEPPITMKVLSVFKSSEVRDLHHINHHGSIKLTLLDGTPKFLRDVARHAASFLHFGFAVRMVTSVS
jgi:hypothetical protein